MSDPAPDTSPPPLPATVPHARNAPRRSGAGRLIGAIALGAAMLAAWLAIDTRMTMRDSDATAGGRIAELGAESKSARAAIAQVQQQLREAQLRVTELESRVADTQEQRVALEEMYRELSRSADDRVLSEVEQMLVLASQQLQLAGNVRGALAALQAADARLARAEKLAATPLRRAITQDMDRLKAVPQVDTVGMAVKIDQLIVQTESLPLLIAETPAAARVTRIRSEEQGIARAARDLWDEMKGLVRIRELDVADPALLSPGQSYFLRENLKLRLLAARVSLLARDESTFRDDLRAAQAWIAKYFDAKARPTAAALAGLKQIHDTPVAIGVPDINASLAAVRTARAAREKR
ncbi:MAG TPA: uroporphyrinogen-III C-methyltransferase [Usitatibacter sp.]|nr:uroporphyrinogen-III C-methyltransferase [Usitatibacter sp.]